MPASNYEQHPSSFRRTVAELAWAEQGQVEMVKAQHPDNAGLIGAVIGSGLAGCLSDRFGRSRNLVWKWMPETAGRSLEEIEQSYH